MSNANARQMADIAIDAMNKEHAELSRPLVRGEISADGYQRRVGVLEGIRMASKILTEICEEYESQ